MFYSYSQTNVEGTYIRNENISELIIIEANSLEEALKYESEHLFLFENHNDFCSCCGFRFCSLDPEDYQNESIEDAFKYYINEHRGIREFIFDENTPYKQKSPYCAVVHLLDGTKKYYEKYEK